VHAQGLGDERVRIDRAADHARRAADAVGIPERERTRRRAAQLEQALLERGAARQPVGGHRATLPEQHPHLVAAVLDDQRSVELLAIGVQDQVRERVARQVALSSRCLSGVAGHTSLAAPDGLGARERSVPKV
jgi:hypothetical protein